MDYNTGFDLSQVTDQERVSSMIGRFKPLILIQGVDCKDWTLLQDNVNYLHRQIQLQRRRTKARKILRQVADWCSQQSKHGRYWQIENPLTSRLWQEPSVLLYNNFVTYLAPKRQSAMQALMAPPTPEENRFAKHTASLETAHQFFVDFNDG